LAGEGTLVNVTGENDLAEVQMEVTVFCFDLIDENAPPLVRQRNTQYKNSV